MEKKNDGEKNNFKNNEEPCYFVLFPQIKTVVYPEEEKIDESAN